MDSNDTPKIIEKTGKDYVEIIRERFKHIEDKDELNQCIIQNLADDLALTVKRLENLQKIYCRT
jgi:hypothetical protein